MSDVDNLMKEKIPELRAKLMNFSTSLEEIEFLYAKDEVKSIIEDGVVNNIISMQNKVRNMPYWYDMNILDSNNVIVTFDYIVNGKCRQVMKHFCLVDDVLELINSWNVEGHVFKGEKQVVRSADLYLVTEGDYVTKLYNYKTLNFVELKDKIVIEEAYRDCLNGLTGSSKVKKKTVM